MEAAGGQGSWDPSGIHSSPGHSFSARLLRSCFSEGRKCKHLSGPLKPGPVSLTRGSPAQCLSATPVVVLTVPSWQATPSGQTGFPTPLSKLPHPHPAIRYPLSQPWFTQRPWILPCLLYFCLPPPEYKILEGWDSVCLTTTVSLYLGTFSKRVTNE